MPDLGPIKSAKSSPKSSYIDLLEDYINTVGHTCSGETLVEGLVELWSGYDVTVVRLDSCLVLLLTS